MVTADIQWLLFNGDLRENSNVMNFMEEDTLLIVGNGFDLGIGFKTSYKDFMDSSYFPNPNESGLSEYLVSVRDKNFGWVDIENELATYSKKLEDMNNCGLEGSYREYSEKFRFEYELLKNGLRNYLKILTSQRMTLKSDNQSKRILEHQHNPVSSIDVC